MAFWKKFYKSKYTGKEIDDAISQVIEGGGGVLNVLFGVGEGESITCNHTFTEIYNALENKQPVIFAEEVEAGGGSGLISTSIEYSASEIMASFYSFSFGSGDATLVITKYIIASDNTITVDYADRGVTTL